MHFYIRILEGTGNKYNSNAYYYKKNNYNGLFLLTISL